MKQSQKMEEEDMMRVIGIALIGVMSAIFLKRLRPEIAIGITILAAIMIACLTLAYLSQYKESILSLNGLLNQYSSYIMLLLKMIGITYICEFCGDICKDAGYQTIAGQVNIFGKCLVLVAGLPILEELLTMILNLTF